MRGSGQQIDEKRFGVDVNIVVSRAGPQPDAAAGGVQPEGAAEARALRRDDVGHLGVGARADLAVLDAPSSLHLAYRPGVPLVRDVLKDGRRG